MAIAKIIFGKSRGSLIPLSFGFFILAMTLTFVSINVASAYSVKKQLTNLAEGAINKSAQSINLLAYYTEVNRFSSVKRVPLDCYAAEGEFYQLINKVRLTATPGSSQNLSSRAHTLTPHLAQQRTCSERSCRADNLRELARYWRYGNSSRACSA